MNLPRRPPRNAPCPCNSGKRFKHCHGAVTRQDDQTGRELLRAAEARELLRRRQQGHGRPIITATDGATRFVAVGKRVVSSNRWRFFTDFLLDNMKRVLGPEWGRDAPRVMPDHPILRWLQKLDREVKKAGLGRPINVTGFVSALNRLCYSLYLIEHNDAPPNSLVKRLRKVSEFDPALYEAVVSSAFALAGAHIAGAEDEKSPGPKPEFFATYQDGRRYAVEAKRKRDWKTPFDLSSDAFLEELSKWLRGKIHAASKKKLTNPVFWFELGIGVNLKPEEMKQLAAVLGQIVDDAESITVDGKPAPPAYVIITNHPDLANDEVLSVGQFALLSGYRMADFRDELVEIEVALERHDKHRPIRRVLECFEEVQQTPNSFDGVPDELLDEDGCQISVPGIGTRIEYPKADDTRGFGFIEEVTAFGSSAWVVVRDEVDSNRSIIKMPLTDAEARAAERLGNAIFGKPEGPNRPANDVFEFYDKMLRVYGDYARDALLNQILDHPRIEEFRTLTRDELVVRVSREIAKSMDARTRARSN